MKEGVCIHVYIYLVEIYFRELAIELAFLLLIECNWHIVLFGIPRSGHWICNLNIAYLPLWLWHMPASCLCAHLMCICPPHVRLPTLCVHLHLVCLTSHGAEQGFSRTLKFFSTDFCTTIYSFNFLVLWLLKDFFYLSFYFPMLFICSRVNYYKIKQFWV